MAFCTNCGAPVDGQFCTKCGTRVGAADSAGEKPPSAPINIPATPAPGIAPAQPVKKRGPLFWVLTGCLGLIVIGVIIVVAGGLFVGQKLKQAGFDPVLMEKNPALAVAKMIAAVNPDVEVLGIDEDRGVIRVRDKKTGKALTVDLAEAKQGKIVFQDDRNQKVELQAQGEGDKASLEIKGAEGTIAVGAGAGKLPDWIPSYSNAEGTGTFGVTSKEGAGGSYSFKTSDSVEAVASFYEEALKGENLEVERTSGQGPVLTLVAKDENSKRSAQIVIAGTAEGTTATITFESGK
jgi:hypothetical protein